MAKIGAFLRARPPWTAGSTLPGGDFPADGFYAQVAEADRAMAVPRPSRTRAG